MRVKTAICRGSILPSSPFPDSGRGCRTLRKARAIFGRKLSWPSLGRVLSRWVINSGVRYGADLLSRFEVKLFACRDLYLFRNLVSKIGLRRRGAGVGLNRLLPVRGAQQLRRKIHQPSIAIPKSTQNPAESVIVPGIPCRERPPWAIPSGGVACRAYRRCGTKEGIETLRDVRPSSRV